MSFISIARVHIALLNYAREGVIIIAGVKAASRDPSLMNASVSAIVYLKKSSRVAIGFHPIDLARSA